MKMVIGRRTSENSFYHSLAGSSLYDFKTLPGVTRHDKIDIMTTLLFSFVFDSRGIPQHYFLCPIEWFQKRNLVLEES